jgi:periplasmic protein TonB
MKTKKTIKANLEKNRFIFFEIGIICSLLLALTAFEWKSMLKDAPVIYISKGNFEDDLGTINFNPDIKKLPPPPPNIEIQIVDDNTAIIERPVILMVEVTGNTEIEPGSFKKADEKPVEEVFRVQIMPKFRNKDHSEFSKFIAENIKYPKIAEENEVEGTVFVKFMIDEKGNLVNPVIYKGIDNALDQEVLRVVRTSEKWTPGIQNLTPVKVSFIFPVKFKLAKK